MGINIHRDLTVRILHYLQTTLDVNAFRWGDVHLWPFMRLALESSLRDIDYIQYVSRVEEAYDAICPTLPPDVILDIDAMIPKVDENTTPLGLGPFVFYANEVDHFRQGPQGFISPVIDSWVNVAGPLKGALKYEILGEGALSRGTRAKPTLFLPPPRADEITNAAKDVQTDSTFLGPANEMLTLVAKQLEILAPGMTGGMAGEINRHFLSTLCSILAFKRRFDLLFEMVQPSAILGIDYATPVGSAFNWAGNERGVPTVEVLHCGVPCFHQAFTHLSALPPEGHHITPRHFLCWDMVSANNIMRWIPEKSRQGHQALVAGNLQYAPGLYSADCDGQLESFLDRQEHSKKVLVSLGGDDESGLVPSLIEMMAKGPKDWVWLVRCHPLAPTLPSKIIQPDHVKRLLAEADVANYEVDLTTAHGLGSVLKLADHHVTILSTSVLDAFTFNVPSTVVGDIGRDAYTPYLDAGVIHGANSAEDIIKSIEAGMGGLNSDQFRSVSISDMARAEHILKALIGRPLEPFPLVK